MSLLLHLESREQSFPNFLVILPFPKVQVALHYVKCTFDMQYYIIGGNTAPGEYSKVMFELTSSMEWTRLEQTLKIEHFAPLAVTIPDELVSKQD